MSCRLKFLIKDNCLRVLCLFPVRVFHLAKCQNKYSSSDLGNDDSLVVK